MVTPYHISQASLIPAGRRGAKRHKTSPTHFLICVNSCPPFRANSCCALNIWCMLPLKKSTSFDSSIFSIKIGHDQNLICCECSGIINLYRSNSPPLGTRLPNSQFVNPWIPRRLWRGGSSVNLPSLTVDADKFSLIPWSYSSGTGHKNPASPRKGQSRPFSTPRNPRYETMCS